jgi:hypothetical protein
MAFRGKNGTYNFIILFISNGWVFVWERLLYKQLLGVSRLFGPLDLDPTIDTMCHCCMSFLFFFLLLLLL